MTRQTHVEPGRFACEAISDTPLVPVVRERVVHRVRVAQQLALR